MTEQEQKIHNEQCNQVRNNWFVYHTPTGDQVNQYVRIRSAAEHLAETILQECPVGADRTAALRMVRETMMAANASIACHNG